MKNLFSAVLSFFFLSVSSLSQIVPPQQPTASPTPPKSVETEEVVKISTTLIQIDVTVTDKSGKIVRDLKPEDFEIYENGVKQDISNFSFISSGATTKSVSPTAALANNPTNKTDVPTPAVQLNSEQVRRTIALVVDDFHLSAEGVSFVRKALRKFVDAQMLPNDLVAIVQSSKGVGALQQFTSDKRRLYAAIENIKWNPVGNSSLTAFEQIDPNLKKLTTIDGSSGTSNTPPLDGTSASLLTGLRDPDKEATDYRQNTIAAVSLNALDYIVRGMRDLPGRKAVMLFSDGFKVSNRGLVGKETVGNIENSLQKITDSAASASVVVYTIDTRGLELLGITVADMTTDKSSQETESKISERRDNFSDTQEGLSVLAAKTGGRAFFNNNDFNKSLDAALENQKNYYLIGYEPKAENFDVKAARFSNLQIKVKRENVDVRYRSGFFVTTVEKNVEAKPSVSQQLAKAISSPFSANEINVRFNALFGSENDQNGYVRSLLHVDTKDLQFSAEANGDKKAVFDVMAAAFDENGVQVDKIGSTFTVTANEKIFEKITREGFVYNFIYPVKKPGAYQIRVAIRDKATGKIGSANQFVEVPNLKEKRLALSGVILESFTAAQWEKFSQNSATQDRPDPMVDTSLRRLKRGSVLRYAVEIYNAEEADTSELNAQIKIFRNGKLVLSGKPSAVEDDESNFTGAINLGAELPPGDYILQIIVADKLSKEKNKSAMQWVQFEIVE